MNSDLLQDKLTSLIMRLHESTSMDCEYLKNTLGELTNQQEQTLIPIINRQVFTQRLNIINFMKKSVENKLKEEEDIRRVIYNFLAEYFSQNNQSLLPFFQIMFKICYDMFRSEQISKNKQLALRPLICILDVFQNSQAIKISFNPSQFHNQLINVIKISKLTASVRGTIWQLLGSIQCKFPQLISSKNKEDVQKISFGELKGLLEEDKNIGAMSSIVNSLSKSLSQNYLSSQNLEELFKISQALMNPIKSTYEINKSALQFLAKQCQLLHPYIMKSGKKIFENCYNLMSHKNKELKYTALETMVILVADMVQDITNDYEDPNKKNLYGFMLEKMWNKLQDQANWGLQKKTEQEIGYRKQTGNVVFIVKILGILSPLIRLISGKNSLHKFFTKLLSICNRKVIKSFEEPISTQNVKYILLKIILYNQKELVSFIMSFSKIIEQLDTLQEHQAVQLQDLFILAIKQHPFVLQKYLPQLTETMVRFIMGISTKREIAVKWMKKVVLSGLMNSLDSSRFNVTDDRQYYKMIKSASTIWSSILNHRVWISLNIFEFSKIFFDTIQHLILNLDISYKSLSGLEDVDREEEDQQKNDQQNLVSIFFLADEQIQLSNMSDYQYMCSISQVYFQILSTINVSLYNYRICQFYLAVMQRIRIFPKCIPLMKIIRGLNAFIIRTFFLDSINVKENKQLVYYMRNLFKEVNDSVFKYQDYYFYQGLKLLLSMPHQIYLSQNCQFLKYDVEKIMIKSLQIGQQIISLTFSTLRCLDELFKVSKEKAHIHLSKVLPYLEQYVSNKLKSQKQQVKSYLLISQLNLSRDQAAKQVIKFIGSIGGLCHLLVEKHTQDHTSWDYQTRIDFSISMAGEIYQLNFNKLITRVCWLMLNGRDKVKMVSCQFMHAVVVYVLGKVGSIKLSPKQILSTTLDKVLPTILRVAANTSHPSQQLIHSLLMQTIHFLANTFQPNSPDIQTLLEHLLDLYKQAQDLSMLASKCMAELVKYHIKQQSKKSQYPLVKTTFRNIWSLIPNRKARNGLINLLTKLLKVIHRQPELMATYALQFFSLLIALSKTDKQKQVQFQYLINKYILSLKPYIKRLIIEQQNRKFRKLSTILKALQWVYQNGLFSQHIQQRQICYIMWQKILSQYGSSLNLDVLKFLYERSRKDLRYLFPHIKPVIINPDQPKLDKNVRRIASQSQIWYKINNKYFQSVKLVKFNDLDKVLIVSFVSLASYLTNHFVNLQSNLKILPEQTQKGLIVCIYSFLKLISQFSGSAKQQIDRIVSVRFSQNQFNDNLFKSSEHAFVNFVLTLILLPTEMIKNFNFEILQKYQKFFEVVIKYCQGYMDNNLINEIIKIIYRKFKCDWLNLIKCIVFSTENLYQRQVINLFQAITQINLHHKNICHQVEKQIHSAISILDIKDEETISKRQILIQFIFAHSHLEIVKVFIITNLTKKTQLFQTYQKTWIKNIIKLWSVIGQRIVNISNHNPQILNLLFTLCIILPEKDQQQLFEYIQESLRHSDDKYLEESLKINFIMIDSEREVDLNYQNYVHGLVLTSLENKHFRIQEEALYLGSLLLRKYPHEDFKKLFRSKISSLNNFYVPLTISKLKTSEEKSNCTQFLKAVKNTILLSKQLQIVEFLFGFFKDPQLSDYYRNLINQIIIEALQGAYSKQKQQKQREKLSWMMKRFWNQKLDLDCWCNFRVLTVDYLLNPAIGLTNRAISIQLFNNEGQKLIEVLKTPFRGSIEEVVLLLQLKKSAYKILESIYAILPRKDKDIQNIHRKQLHKQIIVLSVDSVKLNFSHLKLLEEHENKHKNKQILRQYCCAAFNCLIVIFISTQSNKEHFKRYIFQNNKQILWENLIDPNFKEFQFQIQTNFPIMKPVSKINFNVESKIKKKYWQNSLFAIQQDYIPNTIVQAEPIRQIYQEQPIINHPIQIQLQLDSINKHPCMVNLLRVIDHLHNHYSDGTIPSWMGPIYDQLINEQCPLSIRIFLTKLILNRHKIFSQQMWAKPLFQYLTLTDNGGKFIHYFFRDVAKQVANFLKEGFKPGFRILNTVIMKIVKALPHENNIVYSDNIDLLQSFLKCEEAVLQKSTIIKMLKSSSSSQQSQKSNQKFEWRLCGVIVLKNCLFYKVPVLNIVEGAQIDLKDMSFYYNFKDGLLNLVLEMIKDNSKKYIIAASGLIGEFLKYLFESKASKQIKQQTFRQITVFIHSITNKSDRNSNLKFASAIYNISIKFPQILEDNLLFGQLETDLVQNNKHRVQILHCFIKYCEYIKQHQTLGSLPRLLVTIRGSHLNIIQDSNVQKTLITLLYQCSKYRFLQDKEIFQTYYFIFKQLSKVYSASLDEDNSLCFYKMVISLYDFVNDPDFPKTQITRKFTPILKTTLIKGLGSPFESIKKQIFHIFQNPLKEYSQASTRLIQIFTEIYDDQNQQLWLVNIVPLIFNLAKQSSDYNRLRFETSLSDTARYYDWDFRNNLKFQNASQPYTPIFTMQNTVKAMDPSLISIGGDKLRGLLKASQNQYLSQEDQVFTILASQNDESSVNSFDQTDLLESQPQSVRDRVNQIFKNKKKRVNQKFQNFKDSNMNQLTSSPINIVDNKIRFRKAYNTTKTGRNQLKKDQEQKKNTLLRKYKIGELPDIQITTKDVLDPLVYLSNNDNELAGELFSILFIGICQKSKFETKNQLKQIICKLLSHSKMYDFNFISTLQKSLICLCQNEQKISFSMKQLAFKSNTFDYAIVFTEENLIQTINDPELQNLQAWNASIQCQWGDLIELYHRLNEQDVIYGILLQIANEEERSYIVKSLQLKKDGKISSSKQIFDKLLETSRNNNIKKFLEREKIDCQTLLGNWEEVMGNLSHKIQTNQTHFTHDQYKLLTISLFNANQTTATNIINEIKINQSKYHYEKAICSIIGYHDLNKALYLSDQTNKMFCNQWNRLSSFAFHSKHDLLQTIQKNYELKQFLAVYTKLDPTYQMCESLFDKWSKRQPSYLHDTNITWIQILEARIKFGKMLQDKIGLSPVQIAKANTDWLIQVANGMVSKGALGGAEQLIRRALKYKKNYPSFIWQFYQSISELKLKQLILENNTDFKAYEIVPKLIQKQMEKEVNVGEINRLKLCFVQNQFYQGYISCCLWDRQKLQVYQFSNKIQIIYQNYDKLCKNKSFKKDQVSHEFKTKVYLSFAHFLQKVLGIIRGRFQIKNVIEALGNKNFTSDKIAHAFVQALIQTIESINLPQQIDLSPQNISILILKLLKIVQAHHQYIGKYFSQAITDNKIPSWIFRPYIPHIIKLLNSFQLAPYFEDLFQSLLNLYPETLVYHFNCSYQRRNQCITPLAQRMYDQLHSKMQIYFKFIQNLQLLHHPELRLKQIMQRINNPDQQEIVLLELQELIAPNDQLGKYNKKFVQDWQSRIKKTINQKRAMDFHLNDFKNIMKNLEAKDENQNRGAFMKLNDASTFFEDYTAMGENRLQVPGVGLKYQEPVAWRKVYIESFEHSILTLASIRKPKRISVLGSNQKKYMLLVKGGQDVRLDQRVEELFGLVNQIMSKDCECSKKELQIKRFEVVPMKRLLGVFQWVDHSQTMRQFLEVQFKEIKGQKSNLKDKFKAFELRREYLDEICPDFKQDRNIQHKALLNRPPTQVIKKFKDCERQIPYGLLRKALEKLCKSYDSYLHVKNKFICNYAVTCLITYIFGIGDRHLQNFLIHSHSASVILIDFGYSFGSSIDLKVPELVPFRLTNVIKQLTDPTGYEGLFKNSLINCFEALSQRVPLIVDFCEVFIDDPLAEWIWASKKRSNQTNPQVGITFSISQQPPQKIYFSKRIQYVQRKLNGQNPRILLEQALSQSIHSSEIYFQTLKKAIWAQNPKSPRLSSSDYVDALITLATDKNILGRAYTGWAPYI